MGDVMLPVSNFERGGVVLDSDPFSLANNEWSNCRNVRFDNRSVSKITGEVVLSATTSAPREFIYWQQPGTSPDRYVYVDSTGLVRTLILSDTNGDNILNALDSGSNPIPLSTANNNIIDLNLFNGGATLLINDGASIPKFIHSPDVSNQGATTAALVDFDASWNRVGIISTTAEVVRPFRNVIMAGNLSFTTSSNQRVFGPSTLRVSNLATRGAIPNWDATYAGATNADEFDLATNSPIIDMIPFQDAMAVYTTDSIWLVRLTGSTTLPVSVTPGSQGRGMLSKNCGVEFYGRHFVVGNEDIYIYGGGAQVKSVAEGRVRDYFFNRLNRNRIDLVNVAHNRQQSEIWISYPTGANVFMNEVLIYNYDNDTWTLRDAVLSRYMTSGPSSTLGESTGGVISSWTYNSNTQQPGNGNFSLRNEAGSGVITVDNQDADGGTPSLTSLSRGSTITITAEATGAILYTSAITSTSTFGDDRIVVSMENTIELADFENGDRYIIATAIMNPSVYNNSDQRVVFATSFLNNHNLIQTDEGNSFILDTGDTTVPIQIPAFVERRGFDIAPTSTNVNKWTDSAYYLITGTGDVTINTRATEAPGRPVDFSDNSDRYLKTRTFSLNSTMGDYKIDPRSNGRYYNTRIESNDATDTWSLIRYNLSFSTDDER